MRIETAIVYVAAGSKSAADEMQGECLRMNGEGWRLIATLPDTAAGGDLTGAYLFFEREILTPDGREEAVAAMDAEERRELMDVAVSQSGG